MRPDYAARYEEYVNRHWWFRARRVILRRLLARYLPSGTPLILEIGTGPGDNLYSIYPPGTRLMGLEPDPINQQKAAARGAVPVYLGRAEEWPAELQAATPDVVAMFDVLEHVEDDRRLLKNMYGRLAAGGSLFLTVPAYRWLWGAQDEVSQHRRRYTRGELTSKLREAGFVVRRSTYFNTILLPLVALVRLLARLKRSSSPAVTDFEMNTGCLDPLLYALFAGENYFLPVMNFPFGVSIFVVADKARPTVSRP